MIEHVLEQHGIARLGHALERCLREVAVVIAHENRHTRRHRRVDLVGGLAPLLHGVMQEHVLVHVISDLGKIGIVLLAQLQDGYLDVPTKGLHQFGKKLLAALLAKGEQQALVVERHGHELSVHVCKHLVLIVGPLGKTRKERMDALVKRVINVRTVLMDQNARLVVIVVGIAGDVVAALEYSDAETGGLGKTTSAHCTRVTSAYDDHVVGTRIKISRKTRVDLHDIAPCRLRRPLALVRWAAAVTTTHRLFIPSIIATEEYNCPVIPKAHHDQAQMDPFQQGAS